MTARFERLSILDGTLLSFLLAILATFLFTSPAHAQINKTSFAVLEIKNLQIPNLPELPTIQAFKLDANKDSENAEKVETTSQLAMVPTPAPVPQVTAVVMRKAATLIKSSTITNSQVPPKKVGAERVYMHEPEIRAYICPKLGDKCNTFLAVLKAENGTHECTRDNRGLNRNGSIDIGLAQINWKPGNPWHTFENLQDCKYNLDVALEMYKRRGFQPWYAYTKGAYLKHMPAVLASATAIAAEATKPAAVPVTN